MNALDPAIHHIPRITLGRHDCSSQPRLPGRKIASKPCDLCASRDRFCTKSKRPACQPCHHCPAHFVARRRTCNGIGARRNGMLTCIPLPAVSWESADGDLPGLKSMAAICSIWKPCLLAALCFAGLITRDCPKGRGFKRPLQDLLITPFDSRRWPRRPGLHSGKLHPGPSTAHL